MAREARDLERRVRAERPAVPRRRTVLPAGELDATGLPGLAVGDGLEAAFALFGKPAHSDHLAAQELALWPELGLQLTVCRPGYVVTAMTVYWDKKELVRATSAALARTFRPSPFRGRGGIGRGATARAIRATYGTPTFDNRWKEGARAVRTLSYDELRFELANDAAVLAAIGA